MGSRTSRRLLLGCCLIPLLSFPTALLSDRTLFLRDIGTVWLPQVEAVVRQVGNGDLPFFDARRGFGQPLFADPRTEVLYPPAWIHWVTPPEKSIAFFCAFHLVLAALGAARLLRRLAPDANIAAQLTAGLAFGASGPLLSLVSTGHHLAAAAWMPWIIEKCDPQPGRRTPWLSLAGLVTLQILAGSPDYSLTTFLLCFLRLITRTDVPGLVRTRVGGALALGILLSSVQLLPSWSYARDAARESSPSGWAISPLHKALTIETVLPVRAEGWPLTKEAGDALFGGRPVWMFSHYLGLSVWVLGGLGLTRMRSQDRWFALGAVGLGLLLSWGIRDPSLQELVGGVPLVSGLRFPTKHLAAASLGLALLAACAAATPLSLDGRMRRLILVGVTGALLVFVVVYVWATGGALPQAPVLRRLLGPVALTLALAAFGHRIDSRNRLMPIVVGLDLLGAHAPLNPTTPAALFKERPPLSAVIPAGSRLYVSDYSISLPRTAQRPVRPPQGVPYRLLQVPAGYSLGESLVLAAAWYLNPPIAGRFGYLGSFDLDILDFYRRHLKTVVQEFVSSTDPELVLDRLRRGSVDYVVTMDPPGLWKSLPIVTEERRFFEDVVRVYRVPDPWPRVRFETSEGALGEGSVKVAEMSDGRMRIEGSSDSAARLVVACSNDRGWHAFIDGQETAVSDSPLAFVSVPWNAGRHVVEFRYRPPLIEIGVVLSASALAALLALSFRDRRVKNA